MSTLPFTADDVVAAFDRHPEIKPISGFFRTMDSRNRITACCGLSIMAIDAGHSDAVASMTKSIQSSVAAFRKTMGWPGETESDLIRNSDPECQFMHGFDSDFHERMLPLQQSENQAFMVGFRAQQLLKDRIK